MPELVIDFITSLDGYGAAEGWPDWWGLEGPEYLAWLGDAPERDYTVLMGANTYRVMSNLAAEGEPGTDVLAAPSTVASSCSSTFPRSCTNHPGPKATSAQVRYRAPCPPDTRPPDGST